MNKLNVCTKSIAESMVSWKSPGTAAHFTVEETETQETVGTQIQCQRQTLEGWASH